MKIKLFLILTLFTSVNLFAQVSSNEVGIDGKFYSKEESLFKAKKFLMENIIGATEKPVRFYADPLAAAASGQLTTLYYLCEEKNAEGLLIGFYGNYWNKEGVVYQGYAFRNFNKDEAIDFFEKIEETIKANMDYLYKGTDDFNVVFKYKDISIIISSNYKNYDFRVFWGDFDSTWENTSYSRSKRRFLKKLD